MNRDNASEARADEVLFRLGLDGSEEYPVSRHPRHEHFFVGDETGPWLGPVAIDDLFEAVSALAAFNGRTVDVDPSTVTAVTGIWDVGTVADALLPSLDKSASGGAEFTINGMLWQSDGAGFAYPYDVDASGLEILAEESWSNHGLGMPMAPDSGTYRLTKLGARYLVVHDSAGSKTLEDVLAAESDAEAIGQFEERWTIDEPLED